MLLAIKTSFAFVGASIGAFLGGCDGLLYALVAFMAIDYITGVAYAIFTKHLSSMVGFKGIFKKFVIIAFVGIANIIDTQILTNGAILRTAVIFFYLSNEGISIIENASNLGLPIPKKLKNVLEQLKDGEEK